MSNLLEIRIEGQEGLEALMAKLAKGLDTIEILDEGSAVLFNRIRTRFLQCVDPEGTPWPVSKAAQYRARIGRGGGTLFDTGKLFRSLQLHSDVPETTRSISTDVPYGKFHMTGTIRMPQRVFLGFAPDDVTYMAALVAKRIGEQLSAQ